MDDKNEVVKFQVVRGDVEDNSTHYDPNTKTIYYNPQSGLMTPNGGQTPALGIVHEVGHALIHVEAIENNKLEEFKKDRVDDAMSILTGKTPAGEMEVIRRFEIPAAKKAGEPVRTEYVGFPYETMGPTTAKPTPTGRATIQRETNGGER